MKKIKVAVIGGGNISNTRHIPALKKNKSVEIIGVVSERDRSIERSVSNIGECETLLLKAGRSFTEQMQKCKWLESVDAVVIGVPPKEHYHLIKAALECGKHVLVEKPMTMNEDEASQLIELSKKEKKIFCVMHNFQFTNGVQRLEKMLGGGEFGRIQSFMELQLTNRNRRLPDWYNDLPLGLFYDEAAHFIYMLEKFGGKITVEGANAQFNHDKSDSTPKLMNVMMKAGGVPVDLMLNFDSPVCEWYFVVCGTEKIAYYDLFKDILVVLPTDGEHYAKEILKNSWMTTYQYWVGFIKNGFKMLSGNLLYGHDVVISKFIQSVSDGNLVDHNISAEKGLSTVITMNEIVKAVEDSKK